MDLAFAAAKMNITVLVCRAELRLVLAKRSSLLVSTNGVKNAASCSITAHSSTIDVIVYSSGSFFHGGWSAPLSQHALDIAVKHLAPALTLSPEACSTEVDTLRNLFHAGLFSHKECNGCSISGVICMNCSLSPWTMSFTPLFEHLPTEIPVDDLL